MTTDSLATGNQFGTLPTDEINYMRNAVKATVDVIAVAESRRRRSPWCSRSVLAPLATELPEKANSFFWVREGKDSTRPRQHHRGDGLPVDDPGRVRNGVHDWRLDHYAVLSGLLGLAGGGLAYWALRLRGRLEPLAIVDLARPVRCLHRLRRASVRARRAPRARPRRASSVTPCRSRCAIRPSASTMNVIAARPSISSRTCASPPRCRRRLRRRDRRPRAG